MKALNSNIWTKLSVKEIEKANYQTACCLNAKVNVNSKPAK